MKLNRGHTDSLARYREPALPLTANLQEHIGANLRNKSAKPARIRRLAPDLLLYTWFRAHNAHRVAPFPQQGGEYPPTGRPDWMSQGNTRAIDVQPVEIGCFEIQSPGTSQHLDREGFVKFDEIDLAMVKSAARSAFSTAGTGPMPILAGSTPTTAHERMRANGFKP